MSAKNFNRMRVATLAKTPKLRTAMTEDFAWDDIFTRHIMGMGRSAYSQSDKMVNALSE